MVWSLSVEGVYMEVLTLSGSHFSEGKHLQSAHYGIFLEKVFSLHWHPMAKVPGVPCRAQQLRFDIKLDWLEMQEQELPLTVSQHMVVHRREVSFGRWARAFPIKGLVSTRLRQVEHHKDLP